MRHPVRFLMGCLLALGLSAWALDAAPARNLALVVGNDSYANVTSLQKAVDDAQAIGDELEKLGYVVRRAENVDQRGFSRALVAFDADIQPGDRALFFYAGHGFEIDGTNYLLPTDVPAAQANQEDLIRDASFPVGRIIDGIRQRGAGVAVLVLDACRDNPFANNFSRSAALGRGLARVDAPEGVFVLMSAGAKQEALDRLSDQDGNPNSVFTRSFLNELAKPGQTLVEIAKKTQVDVRALAASVGHDQTPAYYDQVIGDVVLSDAAAQAGPQTAGTEARSTVGPNIKTQINITGQTQAGAGVQIGSGTQIGAGVMIGNKEAKIAVRNQANPPGSDPAKALNVQQGGTPTDTQLALLQPDSKLGNKTQQPLARAPIASFMRSNSGWTVTISLPEPATALAYRMGEAGEFKETGLLDVLDQRTGARMPNPSFPLSPRAPAGVIEVRYRTADGTDVGPFPIRFDPDVALYQNQRQNLEQISGSWVEFRDFNGTLVYFTTLLSYRCAITEVRYGLNGAPPLTRFDLPVCNTKDPFEIPNNAKTYLKVPPNTKSISVQLTWRDRSQSEVNTVEKD
ncbi:caspase family protein [Labrys miyagiensis]|nr:caspase family protein [Labrys miyagiensis]